jgi:hypothetical protein
MQALILNTLGSGLKEKVYNPGYNFKLPFIEVIFTLLSNKLSMIVG